MIQSEELPANLVALLKGRMTGSELRRVLDTTLLSVGRIHGLIDALDMVKAVPGDTAEVGVANGGTSRLIAGLNGNRRHWVCDTFEGLVDVCAHDTLTNGQFHNPAEKVEAVLNGLDNVAMVAGYFPKCAPMLMKRAKYSLVHIDVDTYISIKACFAFFATRMSPGGIVVLDDVLERGCVGAIKAFAEMQKSNSGAWQVVARNAQQAVVRFK